MTIGGLALAWVLPGCARLDFGTQDGLAYFEPVPYFLAATTDKCVTTGTVVLLPGSGKIVKLKSGFGTADLSVTLTNGMIASVGQKTDTSVPAMITSLAAASTAGAAIAAPAEKGACEPKAVLYPIEDGVVDVNSPQVLPISPASE